MLEAFCDGIEGLRAVVEIFLADTLETLQELDAAVVRADEEAIRLLAHRAGGSSAACGANTLATLLSRLETSATAITPDQAAVLAGDINVEFDVVK